MLPSEVNVTNVKDALEFNRQGSVINYQQYTFYVGEHGPFTEKFYAGEQDAPAVERRINYRVTTLRQLGVLPQQ
jgi:hypothetical protein